MHDSTHGFIKHAGLPVLILGCGTVNEAVAQDMIVDAMISTDSIRGWTSESLHSVFGDRTFYK